MKLYVVALYGLAAIGGFAFASHMNPRSEPNGKEPAVAPKKMKNLLREGDIDGTMEAARHLLTDLKAANWDPWKIPLERYRVPDQDYAEDTVARESNIPTFAAHQIKPETYGPVVFFSSLYMRRNVRVTPGIEAATHPEGFFIVAYKTGEIKKISVWDVRVGPVDRSGHHYFCFPGMPAYSEDLPTIVGDYHY